MAIEKPSVPTLDEFLSLVKYKSLARMERFFVNFPVPGENGRTMSLLCEQAAIPGKNINARTIRINGLNEYRAQAADFMGESITMQFLIDTDYLPRLVMEEWMNLCVSKPNEGREIGFYKDYAKDITLHALVPAGLPGEAILNFSPTQADFGLRQGVENFRKTNPTLAIPLDKAVRSVRNRASEALTKAKTQIARNISPLANPLIEAFRDTETIAYSIKLVECWPTSINVMPLGYDAVGVQRMSVTFTYKYWESEVADMSKTEEIASSMQINLSTLAKQGVTKLTTVGTQLGTDLKRAASEKLQNITRSMRR